MSAFGTPIVNPVGGPSPIERAAREAERKRELKVDGRRRDGDEVEINSVQEVDPIRNLKSNDQEEAADDREGSPGYKPTGRPKPTDDRPTIDIQA
ncbi:MAG: hypothetical protein KF768_05550 [Phycisphaeraceae bacterium]|nr:hypothetical protein [Phycisphaeraceae bacterium]